MLERVAHTARRAIEGLEDVEVYVATDHQDIADHAFDAGIECIMTDESCKTGSDRALQAALKLDTQPQYVINLQGDAPFTPPSIIRDMVTAFETHPEYDVVTPVHLLSWDDLDRLRGQKQITPFSGTTATVASDGRALWFSKTIIPAIRKEKELRAESLLSPIHQHIGLYGYRLEALEKFCVMDEGVYEKLEGLEQLRFLENDIPIHTIDIEVEAGFVQSGIDSKEDITRAEKFLEKYGDPMEDYP